MTRIVTFCFVAALSACAPSAHQALAPGAALSPDGPATARPAVASTLSGADPLAAQPCALPTAPDAPCAVQAAEPAGHHHGGHHSGGHDHGAAQPDAAQGAHQHHGAPQPDANQGAHQHHGAPQPPDAGAPPAAAAHDAHAGHDLGPAVSPKPAPAPAPPKAPAAPTKVKDPVCGMMIDPATAKGGSATVGGKTFYFCSSSCRRTFLARAADGGTP